MRGSTVNIWKYIEKITPYLELGYGIDKACSFVDGVPARTVHDHYVKNDEVRSKIDYLRNTPSIAARKNWIKNIQNGVYTPAKDWLVANEPEEFAPKNKLELTGKNGGPIETIDVTKKTPQEILAWLQASLQSE